MPSSPRRQLALLPRRLEEPEVVVERGPGDTLN